MIPVTVWIRWMPPLGNKPGYWSTNHLEDGHVELDKPTDKFSVGWARGKWRKAHGHLLPGQGWGGSAKLVYERGSLFEGAP